MTNLCESVCVLLGWDVYGISRAAHEKTQNSVLNCSVQYTESQVKAKIVTTNMALKHTHDELTNWVICMELTKE